MAAQLTARFDSRQSADLALRRLRRGGIEFSVFELSGPRQGRIDDPPGGGMWSVFPYNMGLTNMGGGVGEPFFTMLGHQAARSRDIPDAAGEAVLRIKLGGDQLSRAREILINANGRDIGVK